MRRPSILKGCWLLCSNQKRLFPKVWLSIPPRFPFDPSKNRNLLSWRSERCKITGSMTPKFPIFKQVWKLFNVFLVLFNVRWPTEYKSCTIEYFTCSSCGTLRFSTPPFYCYFLFCNYCTCALDTKFLSLQASQSFSVNMQKYKGKDQPNKKNTKETSQSPHPSLHQ